LTIVACRDPSVSLSNVLFVSEGERFKISYSVSNDENFEICLLNLLEDSPARSARKPNRDAAYIELVDGVLTISKIAVDPWSLGVIPEDWEVPFMSRVPPQTEYTETFSLPLPVQSRTAYTVKDPKIGSDESSFVKLEVGWVPCHEVNLVETSHGVFRGDAPLILKHQKILGSDERDLRIPTMLQDRERGVSP
jgi:hypothetical protein